MTNRDKEKLGCSLSPQRFSLRANVLTLQIKYMRTTFCNADFEDCSPNSNSVLLAWNTVIIFKKVRVFEAHSTMLRADCILLALFTDITHYSSKEIKSG